MVDTNETRREPGRRRRRSRRAGAKERALTNACSIAASVVKIRPPGRARMGTTLND